MEIMINTAPAYNVKILEAGGKEENLNIMAKEIASLSSERRYCIITDETCDRLFGEDVLSALKETGLSCDKLVFPPGESSKSIGALSEALEFLAENHYTRSDALIALGGGVIGDLTGFIAASYLRGIPYVQIPTTLLSCVDSSVGGKTAINLKAGKNLAGAFWQPSLVLINEDFLASLPDEALLCGLAEVIKCGAIGDKELFDFVSGLTDASSSLEDSLTAARKADSLSFMISHSIKLKKKLVEEDEFDKSSRQLLNFGHTLAHAIEAASSNKVPHGMAVASGMFLCAKACCKTDFFGALPESKAVLSSIESTLSNFGYTLNYGYDTNTLLSYILSDKKRSGDTINLVIAESIGNCVLHTLPVAHLEEFVDAALSP